MKKDYWVSSEERIRSENLFALNNFLIRIKSEHSSPQTVDGYRRALENFLKGISKNISEITADDVFQEIERMSNGRAKTTKAFYLHVVSSFFTHCKNKGFINRTLMKKRWNPKLNRPLPRGLSKSEQAKLRIAAESLSLTHRLIVEFLLTSGCRCNELHLINMNDIDFQKCTVRVHGKGNKWRYVTFSPTASFVFREYLKKHPENSTALLVNRFGNRLSKGWIRHLLKECVDKAELRHEISPHYCRHAFAGNLLEEGKDEDVIKEELGHENFQTTHIYLDVVPSKIVEWYCRCMH